MAEEITKFLDPDAMIIRCEEIIRSLETVAGDQALSMRELLGSAITTFRRCLEHRQAESELSGLKEEADRLQIQDEETYHALNLALEQAMADDLHKEEKTIRLSAPRKARNAARRAYRVALKNVQACERAITLAHVSVNMASQALMQVCFHHAIYIFGNSTDGFQASREALKTLDRSGTTADALRSAARRISELHAPYLRDSDANVLHLPRTRTPDEVRSDARAKFMEIFLPELAASSAFGLLAGEPGHPLLVLFAEPLLSAFRECGQGGLQREGEWRVAVG